jgi:hypothetical protein
MTLRRGRLGGYFACPHYKPGGRGGCDQTVDQAEWEEERAQAARQAMRDAAETKTRRRLSRIEAEANEKILRLQAEAQRVREEVRA